jgi:hypothetical protein
LGELQALDRRLALLGNVADDMRNRIGLVLEVTVCDILEACGRQTLAGELKILDEPTLGFCEGLELAHRVPVFQHARNLKRGTYAQGYLRELVALRGSQPQSRQSTRPEL